MKMLEAKVVRPITQVKDIWKQIIIFCVYFYHNLCSNKKVHILNRFYLLEKTKFNHVHIFYLNYFLTFLFQKFHTERIRSIYLFLQLESIATYQNTLPSESISISLSLSNPHYVIRPILVYYGPAHCLVPISGLAKPIKPN